MPASRRTFIAVTSVCLALSCRSSGEPEAANLVVRSSGDIELRFDRGRGTLDLSRGGKLVFSRATADALIDGELVSFDACDPRAIEGEGDTFVCETPQATLRWSWLLTDHLETELEVVAKRDMVVQRIAPLVVDGDKGAALLLGDHPRNHRILENGRFIAFDSTAQLEMGDTGRFGLASFAPIELRGNSVSNFTQLIADPRHPSASLVSGYLTTERSVPTIGVGFDRGEPSSDGRTPFTQWAAETALIFHGKALKPGEKVASERLYLDLLPSDPLIAMERYANTLAAFQHVRLRHDVPVSWNSWTGGSGTGGHGQAIDQAIIEDAFTVAKRELQPFGFDTFPIDDGWQTATGDWTWDTAKFPGGGKPIAAMVKASGMRAGVWMAPFQVVPEAKLASAHPEWLMHTESGVFGSIAKDRQTLDLSNPAVIAHVKDIAKSARDDGFDQWFKADFTYYAIVGHPGDTRFTNVEAFKTGWRALREAIGPDAFLLGVGMVGLNVGVADAMRLTLDDGPKWDEGDPDDVVDTPRALKATVRSGARRWFYGNRAFVQHEDLLFFRASPDASVPPLTLDEARAFATFVALDGGIVELGDKLSDVAAHPEWIDVLRRVMPVHPHGARPLDVLVRDYPERFQQDVEAPLGKWTNLGLFHWGKNRDLSTNPPTDMSATAPRVHSITCEQECLAWEFWSESFVGRRTGTFDVEVAPHTAKVVALRKATGHPQLLGTNRHVTMGAVEFGPEAWDPMQRALSVDFRAIAGSDDAPFEQRFFFWVPAGSVVDRVTIGAEDAAFVQEGEVVRVKRTHVGAPTTLTMRLVLR